MSELVFPFIAGSLSVFAVYWARPKWGVARVTVVGILIITALILLDTVSL